MIKVLVVDDEEPFRRLLDKELRRKGFQVAVAGDGRAALSALAETSFDVILLDIVMPGADGVSVLRKLKSDPAAPAVIVLTGKATVETAVEAMKRGAYDYITKPYKLDELIIVINRAYEYRQLTIKNQLLRQELIRQEMPAALIARSPRMRTILDLVRKIAPTDSTVLIQGESGTGKELVANTIWRHSRRNAMPFIALNCAAFSETLIESELFGHERGSFTNAYETKHGIVEVADKGTLFLDEIAEMPPAVQPNLLRFLDSGEFRRVGGNKTLKADNRVIAATNKDLLEQKRSGMFREDLFYRLNVISITIPPLRERSEDIEPLAAFFAESYSRKLGKRVAGILPEAVRLLKDYLWPGNVRELENVIERAVILCETETLVPDDLAIPEPPERAGKAAVSTLEQIEKSHIIQVLNDVGRNQTRASRILGIDRKTLYLKLRKYGIREP